MPRGGTTAPETVAPPAEPTGTDPGPSSDPGSGRVAELLADVRRSAPITVAMTAERLDARRRADRPTETVVCVVGEFKRQER
jgi:hypothetical protein